MNNFRFKSDPFEFQHKSLFPANIFDLLPDYHECFIYEDLMNQLDTSDLENKYSPKGQHAYHPRLIVAILIYGYSHGVFSSRQIEQKCHEDLGFMYISHLSCPNFRVLSDFRKANYEFFKLCFRQTVLLAKGAGLLSLGHVSLDGSKFEADTSRHKAMSYKRLKELEKELIEEIEDLISKSIMCDAEEDECYGDKSGYEVSDELKIKEQRLAKIQEAREALEKRESELNPGKKIDDRKQISFADKEARIMGNKGDFDYKYNGQISVDADNQIIVGEHLSQNANDKQEVKAALEEVEWSSGEVPRQVSMDNGYFSGENLEKLSEKGIDAYVAVGKGEGGEGGVNGELEEKEVGKFKKSNFFYDIGYDTYTCPAGHRLSLKSELKNGKRIYKAEESCCINCEYREKCCSSKSSKESNSRIIYSDDKEALRQEMREKMSESSSREIYKRRKVIVEPVFGQLKNLGFRRFHLRGFRKASGEFSLVCSVHNIKKMVKACLEGLVCLEGGKLISVRA